MRERRLDRRDHFRIVLVDHVLEERGPALVLALRALAGAGGRGPVARRLVRALLTLPLAVPFGCRRVARFLLRCSRRRAVFGGRRFFRRFLIFWGVFL